MNDNWESELNDIPEDSENMQVNNDLVFMEKYGITNNIFYTMFTAPMDYFRIAVLSFLFLDVKQQIKSKALVIFIIFAVLNRAISLTNHVMFNTLEIVGAGVFIVLWMLVFETLTHANKPIAPSPIPHEPASCEEYDAIIAESAPVATIHATVGATQPVATMADIMSLVTSAMGTERSVNSLKMEDHLASSFEKIFSL